MCEFCENIKDYKKYKDYSMCDGILYDRENKKYCITTNFLCESFEDGISVGFCPMCGRKLSEVSKK